MRTADVVENMCQSANRPRKTQSIPAQPGHRHQFDGSGRLRSLRRNVADACALADHAQERGRQKRANAGVQQAGCQPCRTQQSLCASAWSAFRPASGCSSMQAASRMTTYWRQTGICWRWRGGSKGNALTNSTGTSQEQTEMKRVFHDGCRTQRHSIEGVHRSDAS